MTVPLEYGRVVIVKDLLDPNGKNPKDRPAMIITPTREIVEDQPLAVIGIATCLPGRPLGATCVRVPWDRRGHPRTGLSTNCAAVCHWIDDAVEQDRILAVIGRISGKYLADIANKLDDLAREPDADAS